MTAVFTPHAVPEATDASRPFWDGTREHRLMLPWCSACDSAFFYPRATCPTCVGPVEWRPAGGNGVVYAVIVEHRPQLTGVSAQPYALALVDTDEGARLLSIIVTENPRAVRVGQSVHLTWLDLDDGRSLPLFEPGTASGDRGGASENVDERNGH